MCKYNNLTEFLYAWKPVASCPGASRGGGERAWYTLHAHASGDPRKKWGNQILSYTLRLSSIELYVMQNPRIITKVMQPVAMESPAHACAVYIKALSPLEGPGYKARKPGTEVVVVRPSINLTIIEI